MSLTICVVNGQARLEVLGLLFQYLHMLRRTGFQKWSWEENKVIADANFRFLEQTEPIDYVEEIAQYMHLFPPEHILSGSHVYYDLDAPVVDRVLSLMTASRARIDCLAKDFEGQTTHSTKWFHMNYFKQELSAEQLQAWEDDSIINSELKFPVPNPYVPTDFTMKTPASEKNNKADNDSGSTQKKNRKKKAGTSNDQAAKASKNVPTLIHHDHLGRVYHLLDSKFGLPRANVYIALESPYGYSSPVNSALGVLTANLFTDSISEQTYPASLAELQYYFYYVRSGFELRFSGFSHKIFTLAYTVLGLFQSLGSRLASGDPQLLQRFQSVKERTFKDYNSSYFIPEKQAKYSRLLMLNERRYCVEEVQECVNKITVQNLSEYLQAFVSKMNVLVVCHGNLDRRDALDLWKALRTTFKWKKVSEAAAFVERVHRLPVGKNVYHIMRDRNPKESNSSVENYYQVGPGSLEVRSMLILLNHLMWEPCFDQLRTKDQLGYSVSSGIRNIGNVFGLTILIQSETYSPKFLDWRIEKFLWKFRARLAKMSKPKYKSSVEGLISEMTRPENNLNESTDRIWEEVTDQTYCFTRVQQQSELVKSITRGDLLAFYDQYILGVQEPSQKDSKTMLNGATPSQYNPKRAKLSSCVYGFGYQRKKPTIDAEDSATSPTSTSNSFPSVKPSSGSSPGLLSSRTQTMWFDGLHLPVKNLSVAPFCCSYGNLFSSVIGLCVLAHTFSNTNLNHMLAGATPFNEEIIDGSPNHPFPALFSCNGISFSGSNSIQPARLIHFLCVCRYGDL